MLKRKNVHFLTSKILQYFGHARAGKREAKVNVEKILLELMLFKAKINVLNCLNFVVKF